MDGSPSIGERFRMRREEFGASLGLTAEWSGLPRDVIDEIERGARKPTTSQFEMLCRGLAVDPGVFFRGEERAPARTPARFREAVSYYKSDPGDLRILALAAEVGRVVHGLWKQGGEQYPLEAHRSRAGLVQDDSQTWMQGYDLGERARMALSEEERPIQSMKALLEGQGVHVTWASFSTKEIDDASVWEPGAAAVILLNRSSERTRKTGSRRAILAHELCHLLHDRGESEPLARLSWDEGDGNYNEAVEKRARAFAPAFLAPRPWLKKWREGLPAEIDPEDLVASVSQHWGLSFEGAAWHCGNAGMIPRGVDRRIAECSSRPKTGVQEAMFEATEEGTQLGLEGIGAQETPSETMDGLASRLVRSLLERGALSASRAREIVSWR